MSDYMVRATAADGQIRAFAITSKEMTEEARVRHNSSPIVTAALGRARAQQQDGRMNKGRKRPSEPADSGRWVRGNGPYGNRQC